MSLTPLTTSLPLRFSITDNGGVLDPEREDAAAGPAHHVMKRNLDDAPMRHRQHVALLVAVKQRIEGNLHPRFERRGAFAARDEVPVWLLRPACPCLRIPDRELFS